jgi:hypothetical protein
MKKTNDVPIRAFELTINMEEAPMRDTGAVATALRQVAARLNAGATFGPIHDPEGRRVGSFAITRKKRDLF